jgi:hypothetical protein
VTHDEIVATIKKRAAFWRHSEHEERRNDCHESAERCALRAGVLDQLADDLVLHQRNPVRRHEPKSDVPAKAERRRPARSLMLVKR